MFHFGHLRLLKRAARLGDYLIVAVQEDEEVVKYKPSDAVGTLYSIDERMEMLRALRMVDEVIKYKTVAEDIQSIEFDIYVKGPDNTHAGIIAAVKYCEDNGKRIVTLPRTEGVSSTYLKRLIGDLVKKQEGIPL
jgi:cytidyltransferase-like protein